MKLSAVFAVPSIAINDTASLAAAFSVTAEYAEVKPTFISAGEYPGMSFNGVNVAVLKMPISVCPT
jgi:hypothetical protein